MLWRSLDRMLKTNPMGHGKHLNHGHNSPQSDTRSWPVDVCLWLHPGWCCRDWHGEGAASCQPERMRICRVRASLNYIAYLLLFPRLVFLKRKEVKEESNCLRMSLGCRSMSLGRGRADVSATPRILRDAFNSAGRYWLSSRVGSQKSGIPTLVLVLGIIWSVGKGSWFRITGKCLLFKYALLPLHICNNLEIEMRWC